ncbi:MAG TPA: sigma-70 family RNA polymerase sigma factor [Thermoanaerobaculia bacterium]|nr:sigma-70 family RNA polymerase sigma factor [Thermoanaerobaculia bacterium]
MAIEAEVPVLAARAADTERLATLFDRHHGRLYRLARRLCFEGEEAADLVQETFLRAARSPRSVPAAEPDGEAWLVRVMVNLAKDRCRRRHVREKAAPLLDPAPASDPEAGLVARTAVAGALAGLGARRRAVVVLAEIEGRTSPEIARLLGMTAVTVRWHLAAARRELARTLAPLAEKGAQR